MKKRNEHRICRLCEWIFFVWIICCWCSSSAWSEETLHRISPLMAPARTLRPDSDSDRPGIRQEEIPPLLEAIRFSAPVTLCGEPVPIKEPHVRQALEKEVLLMLWDRAQVILWLKRAAFYFPHIEKVLAENGMPEDIKYLPIIESSLLSYAQSSVGAAGFWQLMKGTGQKYGLTINSHIDQRRNIFDSTRAACAYLKDLKARFHSYSAAFAAYNMGENGLARQIKIQETDDYYSLYLNTETRRYVYRIIAVKLILENPEKYGFHLQPSDLYPPLDVASIQIKSSRRTPVMLVAKSAQISFLQIKNLNPHIRGYHFGPGKTQFFVPRGKEKDFKKRFASFYKEWEDKTPAVSFHTVRSGETISGIAKKYNMTTKQLLQLNHMSIKKTIHPGDKLKIQ